MISVLGSLLKDASGITDRRFFINALLPSVLFCGLVLSIAVAAGQGLGTAAATWNGTPAGVKTLQVAVFLAAAALLAGGLASQRTTILRWFEGYWTSGLGRGPARIGRQYHRRKHIRLGELITEGDTTAYETVYICYPPLTQPEQVMPTRLGNVLKSAELYPYSRYSIDAVLTWPRLYHQLPERFLTTFSVAKADLDLMLGLSTLSALFSVGSAAYLMGVSGPVWLFLACLWGGALVAYLSYRSALSNAMVYAHQVRVAFDLYRNELRDHLGDGQRRDEADERDYWQRLCLFWYRGIPRDHAATPADADSWEKRSRLWSRLIPAGKAETDMPPPRDNVDPATARPPFTLSLSTWSAVIVTLFGAIGVMVLA